MGHLMAETKAKVFVSGCFDMLHSGHVEFLQQAAEHGELYVALGADRTLYELKGRCPVNNEEERRFMLQSVGCVQEAIISRGSGYLDFAEELRRIQPDIFVVNEDGNTPDKRKLVESLGIRYIVLQRTPHGQLPPRSTTDLRRVNQMPYRIDLAGGWIDQPFVSQHSPGAVVTLSIEPTVEFNDRSGMATSTRRAALDLWGPRLPTGDPAKLAKALFCYDNPPGTEQISGAQDAVGIVYSGLARSLYNGVYWPVAIEHVQEEAALRFVEDLLYLIPLGPRGQEFDVLGDTHITRARAQALAAASDDCWQAIQGCNAPAFGQAVRRSFEAQIAMFPRMMTPMIEELLKQYREHALGWKISGAGGGGYLILVAERPIENALRPLARREFV